MTQNLIVDEAHATGVCGPGGRGCVAEAGLAGRVFATVHTCGKALAAAGAFVCGSEALRRFLINHARTFIFNTALPPYFAAQVAAGMRLAAAAETERAHLADLSGFLRNELLGNGFDTAGSDSHHRARRAGIERRRARFCVALCKPAASAFARFARRRFRAEPLGCACR